MSEGCEREENLGKVGTGDWLGGSLVDSFPSSRPNSLGRTGRDDPAGLLYSLTTSRRGVPRAKATPTEAMVCPPVNPLIDWA